MGVRNLLGLLASSLFGSVLLASRISTADEPGEASAPAPPPLATDPFRVAIRPSWVHAFRPSSVSADGIGLGLEVFPGKNLATGRLGFALVGSLYGPFSRREALSAGIAQAHR